MYNKSEKNKKNEKNDFGNVEKGKEKKPKKNFDLPGFVSSDGKIITYCVGVKIPKAGPDEDKRAILEMALRTFKRKVKEAGVIEDYKLKQEFVKKSVIKRQKKNEAARRERRGYTLPDVI